MVIMSYFHLFKNISKFKLTISVLIYSYLFTYFCALAYDSTPVESSLKLNSQPVNLFMGNRFSLKYHVLNCPYAIIMSKYKRKYFDSQHAAYEAGLKPCRYCLPYKWLNVKASIINK